jgi:DNA-binding winged helix-turn-helix (wHTH) protein
MKAVEFGPFSFDSPKHLLSRGSESLHLTRKAFLLLELLIQSRPSVRSKQQIMDHLWPDCFVSDGNVATLISEIRGALGEEGTAWIRTVHGVGYAFGAAASEPAAAEVPDGQRIVLIEKGPPPRSIELTDGVNLVGRGLECQIRVPSGTVSRRHARIRLAGGAAVLEDLGSRNGTFHRGVRIAEPVGLASGDEIRLGSVALVFRIESPEGETEPVA